ncbi:hypothetical protein JR334_02050 [Clostridia bacterium]|nr:hypothetical protein JR334_02050 [Clostridia bacterium]
MYYASDQLLSKLKESKQAIKPKVYITRPTTAISAQRFWERQKVADAGTACSIAVRRPLNNMLADRIYMAQVVSGSATIMYSDTNDNLNEMEWHTLETISDAVEVSLCFENIMQKENDIVEAYTIGEHPYVFWIDSSGNVKFKNLDLSAEMTLSSSASKVSTTAGLYSSAADVDDGIFCFYITNAGTLWESRIFDGIVQETTQITELPIGVTNWLDVWAGRTFDYRVVLQLKGDDSNIYTLMGKSRPGGFRQDYIGVSTIKLSGLWGKEPPELLSIETVGE